MEIGFIKHDSAGKTWHTSCTCLFAVRALDKREYLVIFRNKFCLFCIKTYVLTPHLNRLSETVQMMGHNIWFR